MLKKLKDSGMLWVAIGVAAFLTIGLIDFLFTKTGGVNGLQIIANQTFNEWFWMIAGSVMAGVVVALYLRFYKKTQDNRGVRAFFWAFAFFIAVAFAKGCDSKANGGVTSGNGRPEPVKVDSTRVAAEDLLPK